MGIVNRIQNAWTRQQLFNPDTLVLRSVDGNNVTVNAASNRPGDEVVILPSPGTVVGFMQASRTADQQLTNTESAIDFNQTGDSYSITRAGANFTVHAAGKYLLALQIRLVQGQNNNVTRFWAVQNGVAIPFFGGSSEPAAAGDAESVFMQGFFNANEGDVFAFRAITSDANGAMLQVLAAAAPAPVVASAGVDITGYLR